GRRYLDNKKMRVDAEPPMRWLRLEVDRGAVHVTEAEPPDPGEVGKRPVQTQLADEILELLEARGPMTRPKVAERLGRTRKDGSVRRVLDRLKEQGSVERDAEHRWGVPGAKRSTGPATGTPKK